MGLWTCRLRRKSTRTRQRIYSCFRNNTSILALERTGSEGALLKIPRYRVHRVGIRWAGSLLKGIRGLTRRRADIVLANVRRYAKEVDESSNIPMQLVIATAWKFNAGRRIRNMN
jgi:hypothetical protein